MPLLVEQNERNYRSHSTVNNMITCLQVTSVFSPLITANEFDLEPCEYFSLCKVNDSSLSKQYSETVDTQANIYRLTKRVMNVTVHTTQNITSCFF